ncbi:MAG: cupredoxin domain-containing protein [Methylocystis sp.]|jgi:plastocyanin
MSKRGKSRWIFSLLLAANAASSFCGGSAAADVSNISIENFAFDPPLLTVSAGTKVIFTNRDQVPHSIIGFRNGEEVFRSREQIDADETYSVVASEPGAIELHCGLHARIIGKIIVTP